MIAAKLEFVPDDVEGLEELPASRLPPPARLRAHDEWPIVVDVECPMCGALAGISCHDLDGRLQLRNHWSRQQALLRRHGR